MTHRLVFIIFFLITFVSLLPARANEPDSAVFKYRYDKDLLSKEFHKGRREALREKMEDNSMAIFFANPVRNRSNDVDFYFHQDPDFYYLTGLREPNSILVIFKEKQLVDSLETDEIIFVQDRDPVFELWNGRRLGKEGVHLLLGFEHVRINNTFAGFDPDYASFSKIYLKKSKAEEPASPLNQSGNFSFTATAKAKTDSLENVDYRKLSYFMGALREIKLEEELVLMRKAIDATCLAHIELMRALKPEMHEYQAQAIIEYFFKHFGAEYPGFPSIVGGGENSCTLHYTTNRRKLSEQDLLVVDVGAEYHGYTADVTRTLPVGGKFTTEQKIIYDIVLEAQEAGIKACTAGNKFWDPGAKATEVIQKRLLKLGIIENPNDVKLYFPHGTSHYLGLDVHDAGTFGKLKPGNVITVEPGIYIPEGSPCDPKWWNIGVRIEDDILITTGAPVNLSESAPRTTKEIEKLMEEASFFDAFIGE